MSRLKIYLMLRMIEARSLYETRQEYFFDHIKQHFFAECNRGFQASFSQRLKPN
jgi:hypothetical protein